MSAEGKGHGKWATWIGILLSLVCIFFLLRKTDLRETGRHLSQANLWLALPLLLGQVLFYGVKAWRWQMLLHPIRPTPVKPLVGPMMIGFMGNNLLPAHLGEFIRMYFGSRLLRVSNSQVLATIVLERMFDFVAVLLFFGWSVVVLGDVPDKLLNGGYIACAVSVVGLGGAVVYVVWTQRLLRFVEVCTGFLPERLRRGVLHQLELGATGMAALRQPRLLFGIIVTSLLQWAFIAGCVYVSVAAVRANASITSSFVVLAATVIGVMVPAAPGYFGTLHGAFMLALTPFGVDENQAFAAAIFYHTIPYIAVTLCGLYFLRRTGMKLAEVEREALEQDAAAT